MASCSLADQLYDAFRRLDRRVDQWDAEVRVFATGESSDGMLRQRRYRDLLRPSLRNHHAGWFHAADEGALLLLL